MVFYGSILWNKNKKRIKKENKIKMSIKKDYDKEHDIFSMNWGGEVEHSRELFDGGLVLDFNKDEEVVGFEIFNFKERCKDSDEYIGKLLEGAI